MASKDRQAFGARFNAPTAQPAPQNASFVMHDPLILDLDGSLENVTNFERCNCRDWGPDIRIACSFGRFHRFQRVLTKRRGPSTSRPVFYGTGDFHHVSLALLNRVSVDCNLLLLDL